MRQLSDPIRAPAAERNRSRRETSVGGVGAGDDEIRPASGFHARSFASLVLLYNCGLIWASVIYMMGGEKYFTYAHIFFFGSSAVVLLMGKGGLEGLLRPLASRWSALFLGAFLIYYLIAALIYPVPEVSVDHLRSLMVRVAPGLFMGYLAFVAISSLRFVVAAEKSQVLSRWRLYIDLIVLLIYAVTIFFAFIFLGQKLRSDYFLIHIAPERSIYQLFGVYLTLALISAFVLIDAYGAHFSRRSVLASALWMLLVASFALASFFICQIAGSNTGAALMAAIGVGLGSYMLVRAWFDRSCNGRFQALAMLAVGLIAIAVFFAVVANVQPLRIFGFNDVDVPRAVQQNLPTETIPGNVPEEDLSIEDEGKFEIEVAASSVSSRLEILSSVGFRQLVHAPFWGDLGVEYIVGTPGNYIHSLVSVQSHLGVIGSILLLGFLIDRLWALYTRGGNAVLKVSVVPILMMAIIGMFFTWTPFWFIVGGLYSLQGNGKTD